MTTETVNKTEQTTYIDIQQIKPNPYQPKSRVTVDNKTVEEYGKSILENGLIQTPVVRQTTGELVPAYEMCDGWLRLAGYRWLTAHGHPEYNQMPVIIRELSDQQMADAVWNANTVRKDLNIIEKAEWYKLYLDKIKITQADFGKMLNLSQAKIANTIRLLDLPKEVQDMVISGEIADSAGRTLLQLKDNPDRLISMAKRTAANKLPVDVLDAEIKAMLGREKKTRHTEPPIQPVQHVLTLDEITPDAETQPPLIKQEPVSPPQTAGELPLLEQADKSPGDTKNSEPLTKTEPTVTNKPVSPTQTPANKTPEAKTSTTKPAAATTPAAPPKWKRKLVIEETDTGVQISLMSAKGFSIKPLSGNLENAIEQLPGILAEMNK